MFMPHVLSLFTYQHPGQLYTDRPPESASEAGALELITWPFSIKFLSLLYWFICRLFVSDGGGDGGWLVCLLA